MERFPGVTRFPFPGQVLAAVRAPLAGESLANRQWQSPEVDARVFP